MPFAMRRSKIFLQLELRAASYCIILLAVLGAGLQPLRLACAALPNFHTISFARKDLPLRFKLLLSFPLAHCAAADPAARILRPEPGRMCQAYGHHLQASGHHAHVKKCRSTLRVRLVCCVRNTSRLPGSLHLRQVLIGCDGVEVRTFGAVFRPKM